MSQPTEKKWRVGMKNTRLELGAYESLANAHDVLAQLPENAGQSMHRIKSARYRDTHSQCSDFVEKLARFGEESGYSMNDFDFEQPSGAIGGEW